VLKIFDKVKTLIGKIRANKSFNIFSNNTTINLTISGDNPKDIVIDGNIISINPKLIEPAHREEFQTILREALQEEGTPILSTDIVPLLEAVQRYKDAGKDVIDELSKIIDSSDILALRAAYIIRDRHKNGEDITDDKLDVIQNYGERGRKICNLCSSDYFENLIIPILREMKKAGELFDKGKFITWYNTIVEEEAFSIFVNIHMTNESLYDNVVKKLERNRSYGITYANIHAIGTNNIKVVKRMLELIEERRPDIQNIREEKVVNTIFVRLELPEKTA